MRIDPAAYKLAVAQMEANIREMQAQISQLDLQGVHSKKVGTFQLVVVTH